MDYDTIEMGDRLDALEDYFRIVQDLIAENLSGKLDDCQLISRLIALEP